MKRLAILALPLLLPSCVLAGAIANGDFEAGLSGWQAVTHGGAQVTVASDKPAAGRGCLVLSCSGSDTAWALGPALPGAAGDLLQLTFSARRGQGKARLLLTLVADAAGLKGVPVWEDVLPADNEWHKVSLLLKTPPVAGGATPRLAFGVAGLAGAWAIDAVDAAPGKALELPAITPTGEAVQTEVLPDGWQPEGLLDARSKELAGQTELLLDVNGIEVGLQPEFSCRRGLRQGMVLYAVNRGDLDKQLLIRMAAPQGIESPAWTVPVRGRGGSPEKNEKTWAGTTRFHTAIQSMRAGTYWVKLIAKSGPDEKAAPIKLTCEAQYPAPGLIWHGKVDPAALAGAGRAGIDLHLLTAPPDLAALQPMVAAVQGHGEHLVGPLLQSLSPMQYAPAVQRLYADLSPGFWAVAPDDSAGSTLSVLPRLVADLHKAKPQSYVVSPPVALARDWQKNELAPTKPAGVTAERLAGVVSVAVQPPVQAPPCVLQQTVDGNADVVSGALAALDRQTDLHGVRGLLASRNLNLPMLVGPLRSLPGSDERLNALYLARAMTNALAEGATGALLEPAASAGEGWGLQPAALAQDETPVQQVARLLSRELAGAAPLVPLADSPGITTAPDATACYRPFLRGGEGVVVLWNNTSVPKDVTVEFRFQPVVWQRLAFSYQGEFATRRWDPIMQFPAAAFKRGRPAIFLRLDPLQVQVHSFRLQTPHAAWLRKVEFTTPFKPVSEPGIPRSDERTWWRDMLGGRGGL